MYFLIQYGVAGDMYSLNTTFSLFKITFVCHTTGSGAHIFCGLDETCQVELPCKI